MQLTFLLSMYEALRWQRAHSPPASSSHGCDNWPWLLQAMAAKDSMGFFGSLPAAVSREQGANKRKSMDLGAHPAQAEPRQVRSHPSWCTGHHKGDSLCRGAFEELSLRAWPT